MPSESKVIAILTANEALSAILQMVLGEHNDLRVRVFNSEAYLSLYMHIAPVDLLVCDYDLEAEGATGLVQRLRAKPSIVRPDFQVVAMARTITPATRAACVRAGIDEVLVKPMSPRYLEERVLARLREGPRHFRAGDHATPERRTGRKSAPSERFIAHRGGDNIMPPPGRLPDNVVPIR